MCYLKNAVSEQVWEHENYDCNNLNRMATRVGQESSFVIQTQMDLLYEPLMPNVTGEGGALK
jgi:hypothetical protein